MTGDTGRLFGEFGVTVAAAVGFSAFIALSLTPMMASKLFANGMPKSRMAGGIDRLFHNLDDRYAEGLRRTLAGRKPLYLHIQYAAADRGGATSTIEMEPQRNKLWIWLMDNVRVVRLGRRADARSSHRVLRPRALALTEMIEDRTGGRS